MFKRCDKRLFLLVFLVVIFFFLQVHHFYFSTKLTQVPLSTTLKFFRTQPGNSSNGTSITDQEAEPMVGIYEKLVENLTFFDDRVANINNSKMWEKVKALAPFDQKTYTYNITECFSGSDCTKYK